MADITKYGIPSMCTVNPPDSDKLQGDLFAGEPIAMGDACYINANGLVYRSNGSAANLAANIHGWAAMKANVGDAITLMFGVNFQYGQNLTPGASYYLSGDVLGGIQSSASTGGTSPCAFAVDTQRIHVMQKVLI